MSGNSGAGSPANAGLAHSKAQLTEFISRQLFAVTYPDHIRTAVAWAIQAADQAPGQSAKVASGTLTASELEGLAQTAMNAVRASMQAADSDD